MHAMSKGSQGLRLGLDPLDRNRQIQAFAKADNCANENGTFAAGDEFLDKASINFELVKPQ